MEQKVITGISKDSTEAEQDALVASWARAFIERYREALTNLANR